MLNLFTFMAPFLGRGIFIIFAGSILFDWNHLAEFFTSLICIIVGILYIIYGFKYDDWSEFNKKREE